MTTKSVIIPLLSHTLPPALFMKIPTDDLPESERDLGSILKEIIATGREISAENVWEYSKDTTTLGEYMEIVNSLDFDNASLRSIRLEMKESASTPFKKINDLAEQKRQIMIKILEERTGKKMEQLLEESGKHVFSTHPEI